MGGPCTAAWANALTKWPCGSTGLPGMNVCTKLLTSWPCGRMGGPTSAAWTNSLTKPPKWKLESGMTIFLSFNSECPLSIFTQYGMWNFAPALPLWNPFGAVNSSRFLGFHRVLNSLEGSELDIVELAVDLL